MSRKQIAQLIGRVFIQKSAVNLLSTVLDTPEFFWSAPDSMQVGAVRGRHGVCDHSSQLGVVGGLGGLGGVRAGRQSRRAGRGGVGQGSVGRAWGS